MRKMSFMYDIGARGRDSSMPHDDQRRELPKGESSVRCPAGKKCRLEVVDRRSMLVQCAIDEADVCTQAILFGGTHFCRALWRMGSEADNR